MLLLTGCSRRFWRRQAERDTYEAVADKLNDPHWAVPRIDLTPDSRSRFFDPYDPDQGPLPPDDPAAHESMQCVSGRRGYKNWHKLGRALSIENPQWLSSYGVLMENADPVHAHNLMKLEDTTLQEAVDLTYIHSREYQTSIEDLYLTALAVTQEQFNLGVRYFGPGVQVPGATATVTDNPGARDTAGLSSRVGAAQLLPAGTQLAVELANNTLWLFGGGTSSSATTLAFSLTQPLLFRAGRKVVLEALTQAERNVLYSARDLARFRQVLFTSVAGSFLRIQRQLQFIRNQEGNILRLEQQIEAQRAKDSRPIKRARAELAAFPEDAVIPEAIVDLLSYDSVLRVLQWDSVTLTEQQKELILSVSGDSEYQAAAAQLIQFREITSTSLSTAQLENQLNAQRNQLQGAQRTLADLTDAFKTTLGLPPNIRLTLDDALLNQFTLIDPEFYVLDQDYRDLKEERGPAMIPKSDRLDSEGVATVLNSSRLFLNDLAALHMRLTNNMERVGTEFRPVEQLIAPSIGIGQTAVDQGSRYFLSVEEKARVTEALASDRKLFAIARSDIWRYGQLINSLQQVLSDDEFPASLDVNDDGNVSDEELPDWWQRIRKAGRGVRSAGNGAGDKLSFDQVVVEARDGVLRLHEKSYPISTSLQTVQAGLRVERVALNRFVLPGGQDFPTIDEVVQMGLSRRRDLMNARAFVMDARRQVEVAASELEATLDVTVSGGLGTRPTSRKPFDFDRTRAGYTAGLAFDTPADKLAERNAYSAALIAYQRARRDYMASEDQVKQDIRVSWRQLKVSEQQLEIDRQTVRIAGTQFDIAAAAATGEGGSALDLLNALDAVLDAQNSLLGDWITWELSRLNIYRDMGIMEIDERGLWIDPFYVESIDIAEPPSGIVEPETAPPAPEDAEIDVSAVDS